MTQVKTRQKPLTIENHNHFLLHPYSNLENLPPAIAKLANHFQRPTAISDFIQTTQISERKAKAIIKKLLRLGFLCPVHKDPQQLREFSALEISFFESPVAPIEEEESARLLSTSNWSTKLASLLSILS